MPISRYSPTNDPHGWGALVASQLADGTTQDRAVGRRIVREVIASGGHCAVWHTAQDPWAVVGFALVSAEPQTVVWCWTAPAARSRKGEPTNGVMTALLRDLGVDLTKPILALYRSPAAEGINRRGKLRIWFADEPQPEEKKDHVRNQNVEVKALSV